MKGQLVKTDQNWVIKTPAQTIQVHKSCIDQLKDSHNKIEVNYSILKDFTNDNNGVEYAMPII